MEVKTIGIASDHAGYALKQFVKKYLDENGYPYKDYGTYSEASCDYSDFGHALAEGIEKGEVYPGIAICGSGEGISMTLNKHQGIRAGLCWIPEIAHLIRQHNNAGDARTLHRRRHRLAHHGRVLRHGVRGWSPPGPHRQDSIEKAVSLLTNNQLHEPPRPILRSAAIFSTMENTMALGILSTMDFQ